MYSALSGPTDWILRYIKKLHLPFLLHILKIEFSTYADARRSNASAFAMQYIVYETGVLTTIV